MWYTPGKAANPLTLEYDSSEGWHVEHIAQGTTMRVRITTPATPEDLKTLINNEVNRVRDVMMADIERSFESEPVTPPCTCALNDWHNR